MAGVCAFVLAGGQSSRMGADKAFLEVDGQPLVLRMLELARAVASDVRIVGSAEKFRGYAEVVEDVFAGCGPLAGIQAALRSSHSDLNLILAVDMPFVLPDFLRYLAERSEASGAIVTVPRSEGRWQPLCAIYRSEFVEVAEASLREGKYKIDPLFDRVEVRSIEEAELAEQGFGTAMFRNLNTPEDLQAAQ
ncbi:MAG TPA: molybdenum cofactor guanylyltransferase [Terriglobales bacterium]|nr:molybdenum cofactor guanylyltransferase [Terriglobales bacterium]